MRQPTESPTVSLFSAAALAEIQSLSLKTRLEIVSNLDQLHEKAIALAERSSKRWLVVGVCIGSALTILFQGIQ